MTDAEMKKGMAEMEKDIADIKEERERLRKRAEEAIELLEVTTPAGLMNPIVGYIMVLEKWQRFD